MFTAVSHEIVVSVEPSYLPAESEPADTFDVDRLPPSFAPANDGDGGEAEVEVKPRRRRLRPAGEAGTAG